ncbi:MAG: chromosome segregation protein SMC [Polyangiaceae bacterium]|nr:chromosome segregation protein SMC [Polyangiaceae bacterium]
MHIKKLEIAGFKSFVDRTVIHFDHDIVGIVGPNGCGKSNIVDSIRWCMGEQSARHLRGRAMSDVIFAGSASRGPHGLAEVTLTFDNTDKVAAQELPLEYRDWAEIAVTRRLYRDGTSEYLINKTQVRLKDVTDLFLGTGVGTKAYSIIEQGKVGLIVSARPEDRRMLIEEAAGITKYKARKKQAEQKMDATRQNLLRVGDIVSEIERSLASLKRQAAKAERYIAHKKELEDVVLWEASHRLLEIVVRTQVEENARAERAEAVQQVKTALDVREAELEVVRQSSHEAEEVAEKAQTDAFRTANQVRTHEGEIERSREKFTSLETRRLDDAREEAELAERLAGLREELQGLLTALETAAAEEERGAEAARLESEKFDELKGSQDAAEAELSDLRARASQLAAAVAGAEATLRGFDERREDMELRRGKIEDEKRRLELEAAEHTAHHAEIVRTLDDQRAEKEASAARRDALNDELRLLREEAVGHERALDTKKGDLSRLRGRLRALEEIHDRLEGVGQGAKTLVHKNDPSVLGLLGERFEVAQDLIAAFAGALGEKVEWVVVDSADKGRALARELAEKSSGRAGIVPAHPRFVAGAGHVDPSVLELPGVRGLLLDAVRFDTADEAMARALLGDVLLCDDDDAAIAAFDSGFTGRAVTVSGTLYAADGTVIGGSRDEVAAGLIEHKREMRELEGLVATADAEVTAMLDHHATLRTRLGELGAALDASRADAHAAEIALVTAEKDEKRTSELLAGLTRRVEVLGRDHDDLSAKILAAAEAHEIAVATLDGHRTEKGEVDIAVASASERAEAWRSQVSAQQSVVTERRVLLAQARERATAVRQTAERIGKSCDEMATRITRLASEQVDCAVSAGQAAARIVIERELLLDALELAKNAEDAVIGAKTRLDEIRHGLGMAEVDLKRLRDEATESAEALRGHESALDRLTMSRQHLLDGVRERFRGLELETVVGDYHKRPPADAAQRARIQELTELLDRMGPVNLDAVREHAEAEERYTYYTTQKTDLEKALDDLDRAIAQMNRESKRLFKEAFEGINARFKVVFPRMFRGGQAELRLTNADDMLETGIEILAQPPGKKLSSIELMSGGEKALTAVSLIFSIFQFKPSPFCILDEVDAPLDEANVARYNEGIRSMTDRSQFILITHIKKTMQLVDVLYGVTMQEPGVSKLVGVRVNEAAITRSASVPPAAEAAVTDDSAAVA